MDLAITAAQPLRMASQLDRSPGAERIQEIAEILAAGLMRLRTRKSSGLSADLGESSLHFTAQQSGPDGPRSPEADA
jgi:hypothetical protein